MNPTDILTALLLGLIEGLTEFLPISSTGHLILFSQMLGFKVPGYDAFIVMIQLGAIFAICFVYYEKLWRVTAGLSSDPWARQFAAGIILAFLPAMIIGVLAHGFIKSVLFAPLPIAIALIVGGFVIILVERNLPTPRYTESDALPLSVCFRIGMIQCLAMIPGVSRSGATIIGALLMGVERKAAAEFSFFLALPTMAGAFAYDAYKNWDVLTMDSAGLIAIGLLAAFAAAYVVVRVVLDFIGRHGFMPFAYYRIALGSAILAVLYAI
ncbi:MAG: undecaprenyl-diphosphate phosphatase [Alphaproteobacteria bacterium]|nr:undecaprenyl-diphosphate phosphatase [Alphaproteobacteria bacterium]